jgi:hypothetical protein
MAAHNSGIAAKAVIEGRRDHLKSARHVAPSSICLAFEDQSFSLPIERLEMPLDHIRWDTLTAHPSGNALTVRAVTGELITIDSSTLRYWVDPEYAKELEAAFAAGRLTRNELADMARDNPPPRELFQ